MVENRKFVCPRQHYAEVEFAVGSNLAACETKIKLNCVVVKGMQDEPPDDDGAAALFGFVLFPQLPGQNYCCCYCLPPPALAKSAMNVQRNHFRNFQNFLKLSFSRFFVDRKLEEKNAFAQNYFYAKTHFAL